MSGLEKVKLTLLFIYHYYYYYYYKLYYTFHIKHFSENPDLLIIIVHLAYIYIYIYSTLYIEQADNIINTHFKCAI